MRIKSAILFLIFIVVSDLYAQAKPSVSKTDRIRLAEAFRLSDFIGDRIWKGWKEIPFAVLLITPDYEFLLRHPKPSKDFISAGYDSVLKSHVYYRKRVFAPNLLATFPAVGGISTVVVGQAENTDSKTSTPWVATLMHEHFHQLQDSQPNVYKDIEVLNLSRGDQTGMWMLNYAFPYDSTEIKAQFLKLTGLLADTLQAKSKEDFKKKSSSYLSVRHDLRKMLNTDDFNYLSLQLWKEGIARYTEYKVAKFAAEKYKPSRAFRSLKDFSTFDNVAHNIRNGILKELSTLQLENYKRVAFYSIGAGEGLMLDKVNPKWSNRYFSEKFYLEKYFEQAK